MADPDMILQQLLEFGYPEAQAIAYSHAYGSTEGAIEAILRDSITQHTETPLPNPASPSPFASASATAASSISHSSSASSNANIVRTDLEERKEVIEPILSRTEWKEIRLTDDTDDGSGGDEETGDGASMMSLHSSTECFEILHSSIALISITSVMQKWSAKSIQQAFERAQSGDSSSPPATTLAAEVTVVGSTSTTASMPSSPVSKTAVISATSSPRLSITEDNTCCICFDAEKDVMLLPCRHLALCSSCALDFFTRTRVHNHAVHQHQLIDRALNGPPPINSMQKTSMRLCVCPSCAVGAEFAVRRKTTKQ